MRADELGHEVDISIRCHCGELVLPQVREESRGEKEKAVTEDSPRIPGRKSNAVFEPTQTHQGALTTVAG